MLNGSQILLVDGDRGSREGNAAALRADGAAVTEAASAQVALLLLQEAAYDLVISEIALPEADGYALIEAIRRLADPNKREVRVIALSGDDTDEERRRALLAGFHLHIARPVSPESLARTVGGLRRVLPPPGWKAEAPPPALDART